VYEEVQYDPPEEIIAAIKALDEERRTVLVNLEKMLG
jgi:type I restriction enzyme M protein